MSTNTDTLTDEQSARLIARAVQSAGGGSNGTVTMQDVEDVGAARIRRILSPDNPSEGFPVQSPLTDAQVDEALVDFGFYGGSITLEGGPTSGFVSRILGTSSSGDGNTQAPAPTGNVGSGGGSTADPTTGTGGGASEQLRQRVSDLTAQVDQLTQQLADAVSGAGSGSSSGGGGPQAGGGGSGGGSGGSQSLVDRLTGNPVMLAAAAVAVYAIIRGT